MTAATREFVPVFDLDRVPSEISNSSRAVVWNLEERDGKPTKIPYVSRRPNERASVSDPTTWGTFAEARAAVEDGKADGVGIVLGDGLIGIDIDDCRDPETGAITPAARAIVAVIGSYAEITPSGCGLHILVRGVLPPNGRRKGNIEIYDAGRYFTVTGTRSVFERYNIVSDGDLRAAAAQLQGLTGTEKGQSGSLSATAESESSRFAK